MSERYLGLATAVGKVADGAVSYVTDIVRGFICVWGENTLSCTAREVHIKANLPYELF